MHSSKFCLHPAGDTPSACRLFDALVSLCVPVIASDYIELPFEDIIDYNKISIFVGTSKAVQPGYLTSTLRRISSERILEYQREIKKVSTDVLTNLDRTAVCMCFLDAVFFCAVIFVFFNWKTMCRLHLQSMLESMWCLNDVITF